MIPTVTNPMGVSEYWPLTLQALENSTVKMEVYMGSPTVSGLKFRKRGNQWAAYTIDTVISLNAGEWVQFKNEADTLNSLGNAARFVMTGKIAAFGDLMSMLNYPSCKYYCFLYLCFATHGLYSMQDLQLPVNLAAYCLSSAFSQCWDMEYGPRILPAKTLVAACYEYMFNWSPKMRKMPLLPADCTAAGWDFRGAFAAAGKAQSTFETVELPFTSLGTRSLQQMFYTSDTVKRIEVNFTDWNDAGGSTLNWVYGVSPSGTFIKPAALPEEYGDSRIPTGWTVVNK